MGPPSGQRDADPSSFVANSRWPQKADGSSLMPPSAPWALLWVGAHSCEAESFLVLTTPVIKLFIPLEMREKGFGPSLKESPGTADSSEGVISLHGNLLKSLIKRRESWVRGA